MHERVRGGKVRGEEEEDKRTRGTYVSLSSIPLRVCL